MVVGDLANAFYYSLRQIFRRNVTVIIYKYLKQHGCVATYLVEDGKNCMFVLIAAIARVKQFEEYCLNENSDNLLQVFAEMQKQTVENLNHKLENGQLLRNTVSKKSVAKCVFYDINEFFAM